MRSCTVFNSREKILSQWELESRRQFAAASDKARSELRDHLPQILMALCEVLNGETANEVKSLSQIHGKQRFSFGDYTLGQVLGEYTLLKNIVFQYLENSNLKLAVAQMKIASQFFDDAASTAASEFSNLRDLESAAARELLEKANVELERFSAVVAHDLRSPLATIKGYCDVIHEESDSPQTIELVQIITAISNRTIDLIDRLLDYSRIEHSEKNLQMVDLDSALASAKDNLHDALKESRLEIVAEPLGQAFGDPILICQLFQNLIGNSVKFRKRGHRAVVHVSGFKDAHGDVQICVADNGVGFDPGKSEEIFKPFRRGHSQNEIQGSGLGLATCEKVIEIHRGTIKAEGTPGVGARFYFTLPKAPNFY